MFEQISIRLAALMIYAAVITILWIVQGAKGMWRENKNVMRLHERDTQINKLLKWQAEALVVLEQMKKQIDAALQDYDMLDKADKRSMDLAKQNADLASFVMVFKSRFPRSYEIVKSEIENEIGALGALADGDVCNPGGATASSGTRGGERATA